MVDNVLESKKILKKYLFNKIKISNEKDICEVIIKNGELGLLVVDGHLYETLKEGNYKICTTKKPLKEKNCVNIAPKSNSFVYIYNEALNYKMLWGTNNLFEVFDNKLNKVFHLGVCGSLNFTIDNFRIFLSKIVGFEDVYTIATLKDFVTDKILMYVKDNITGAIYKENASVYEIVSKQVEISKGLLIVFNELLKEYGLFINSFTIDNILINEKEKQSLGKIVDNKHCHRCGVLLNTEDLFCNKCGENVEVDICDCGNYNNKEIDFCIKCGRRL